MDLFWMFLVASLLILLILLVRNQGRLPWAWNFLIIAGILFIALFKMSGTPRDAWLFATIENEHGEMEVVSQIVLPQKFIYLLLRNRAGEPPYYVRLPWSEAIEQDMDAALMLSREQQTALMVDIDKLSGWSANSKDGSFGGKGKITQKSAAGGHGKGEVEGEGKNPSGVKDGKEGGESMFYPRPVQPDPLKTPVHSPIEVH